jgi:hypothetical protein
MDLADEMNVEVEDDEMGTETGDDDKMGTGTGEDEEMSTETNDNSGVVPVDIQWDEYTYESAAEEEKSTAVVITHPVFFHLHKTSFHVLRYKMHLLVNQL